MSDSDDDINDLPPLPPLEGKLLESYHKLRRFVDAHCINMLDNGEMERIDVLSSLMGAYLRWCRYLQVPQERVIKSLERVINETVAQAYQTPQEIVDAEFRDSDELAAMLQSYTTLLKEFKNSVQPESEPNLDPLDLDSGKLFGGGSSGGNNNLN